MSESTVILKNAVAAAKETLQTTLVALKSVEIVEGTIEGATGLVTVKLVSDQINVTRAADGKVVEGDAHCVDAETYAFLTRSHARVMARAPDLIWKSDSEFGSLS